MYKQILLLGIFYCTLQTDAKTRQLRIQSMKKKGRRLTWIEELFERSCGKNSNLSHGSSEVKAAKDQQSEIQQQNSPRRLMVSWIKMNDALRDWRSYLNRRRTNNKFSGNKIKMFKQTQRKRIWKLRWVLMDWGIDHLDVFWGDLWVTRILASVWNNHP